MKILLVAAWLWTLPLSALIAADRNDTRRGAGEDSAIQALAEDSDGVGMQAVEIPEPGAAALLGLGAATLVLRSWRRARR